MGNRLKQTERDRLEINRISDVVSGISDKMWCIYFIPSKNRKGMGVGQGFIFAISLFGTRKFNSKQEAKNAIKNYGGVNEIKKNIITAQDESLFINKRDFNEFANAILTGEPRYSDEHMNKTMNEMREMRKEIIKKKQRQNRHL